MPVDLAKAKTLFLAALEMPVAQRNGYLDSECAGDSSLRRRVDAMLQTHEDSGELLPRSPGEMLADSSVTEGEATAALGPDPSATQDADGEPADDALGFLTPSAKPGTLGRLGHYEIHEVIGKGGFGIVLKAFDERLHRVVAMKVLSPAYAASGSARKRFIREARAAAAVKSEHIVGIHDVQEDANPPYLVMELIDGVSLQDKIDHIGPLGVTEILRIGTQIAEGLAAAHKQGKIHRDIKPANILLENGVERVKITDFGLARAVDDASVTQSGQIAGTPMYMSPEQAEGHNVDHRSDLFSLGTVLYAMCTGRPPFRATGTMAVLKRVVEETPRPIREINNEAPDWLCEIVAKLHAKKPEGRFQTAKEVADLLGQRLADVQAGRAIEVRAEGRKAPVGAPAVPAPAVAASTLKPPPSERGPAAAHRRSLIAATLLMMVLAAAAGVLVLVFVVGIPWLRGDALLTVVADPGIEMSLTNEDDGSVQAIATGDKRLTAGVYRVDLRCDDGRSLDSVTLWGGTRGFPGDAIKDDVRLKLERGDRATLVVRTRIAHKKQAEPGWVQLFNGKDLDGWVPHPQGRGDWRVQDGMLVGAAPAPQGLLQTVRDDYENFHLRAEVFLDSEDADSGILFRALPSGSNELNIRLDPRVPTQQSGSLAVHQKDVKNSAWTSAPAGLSKVNQWTTVEIIARGPHVVTKVNGKTAAESQTLAGNQRGHIMLQHLGPRTVVRFRTVEIKELPPTEPGWVSLFDGKHVDGWHVAQKHPGSWTVQDGILSGKLTDDKTAARTILVTNRNDLLNFHARIEMKLSAGSTRVAVNGQPPGFTTNELFLRTDLPAPNSLGLALRTAGSTRLENFPFDAAKLKDQWFTLEIIAREPDLVYRIDGKEVARARDVRFEPGHLSLDVAHLGSVLSVRKVEIKELVTPPPVIAPFDSARAKEHQEAWARYLGVDVEFKNSVGMRMRLIPPGEFRMGSTQAEVTEILKGTPAWNIHNVKSETPQRPVVIRRPYYLAAHEVTVGQFRAFAEDAKYETWAERTGKGSRSWDSKAREMVLKPGFTWKSGFVAATENHPVVNLHREDVEAFCRWLSKNEGRHYAIPSEEQWEFACRAGSVTRWPWSDADAEASKFAWFGEAATSARQMPVGLRIANPFGLFDMAGNVAEMTLDAQDGLVMRGGHAGYPALQLRSAAREIEKHTDPTYRNGIRLAILTEPAPAAPPHTEAWVDLFNGKDVPGWSEGKPDRWQVKEGVLIGTGELALLEVAKGLRDFRCRVEAKVVSKGSASVDFRRANGTLGQAVLESRYANIRAGSLALYIPPKPGVTLVHSDKPPASPDGWIALEITVVGNKATIQVDGVTTVKEHVIPELPTRGSLMLSVIDKGAAVHFKKIAIKELPADRFVNDIGMEFARIPKGKAWLGGSAGTEGKRTVEFKEDFYLGVYEVTQEEWLKLMDKNPSHYSRDGKGSELVAAVRPENLKRFPVENVSWDDCQEFLKRLNAKTKETGWKYRLPTEDEWEYACRGGPMEKKDVSAFVYYWDTPTNTPDGKKANLPNTGLNRTDKVGSYTANPLGLFDMHGNVEEWCDDDIGNSPFAPFLPQRPHRGGFFGGVCTVGIRGTAAQTSPSNTRGLRVARVPVRAPVAEKGVLDFAEIHDADEKTFDAWIAKMKQDDFRAISLSVLPVNNAPRYTAVAIKEETKRAWDFTRFAVGGNDRQMYQQMWDKKFAAVALDMYTDKGALQQAILWVQKETPLQNGIWTGDLDFINKKITEEWAAGKKQVVNRNAFLFNGKLVHSLIVDDIGLETGVWSNETVEMSKASAAKRKADGWRPIHLWWYSTPKDIQFGHIAARDPDGPDSEYSWLITAKEYEADLIERKKQGFRPQVVAPHDDGRFSVIWVRYR